MTDDAALAEPAAPEDAQPAPPLPDSPGDTKPPAPADAAAMVTPPAEKVDDEPPAPDEPPPPWATIDGNPYADAYEAWDSPAFKDLRARRDREVQGQAIEHGRTEAAKGFNSGQAKEAARDFNAHLGRAIDRIEGGDVEGAGRIVDKLRELKEPYDKTRQSDIFAAGKDDGGTGTARAFQQLLLSDLPIKARHELEDFFQESRPWGEVLKKYRALLEPAISARLETDITGRLGREAKAREKEEGKPPAEPKGGAGGGGTGYRTKTEARNLHAQNKITNEEMRRVRADPNIPN